METQAKEVGPYSILATAGLVVLLVLTSPLGIFLFTAPLWWLLLFYVGKRVWKGHSSL